MEINLNSKAGLDLLSVGELQDKEFRVAYYQRGYRWKEAQIKQLLDDLNSFSPDNKSQFYFLQALVISEHSTEWNVVDGQQRLTTISLIQKFLNENDVLSIRYDRSASSNHIGAIDEHYRRRANETIGKWFGGKSDVDRAAFKKKMFNAKFLLYRVPHEEEQLVFERLNSGKISTKDSELVKFVMLTTLLDEPQEVTQARAREWDEIDRALKNDQFFAFFVPKNTWREDDRMAMLFCCAGLCVELNENRKKNEVFPFFACVQQAISKSSRIEVWKKIYSAYYSLAAWYEDSVMYHAVGWYVHGYGNVNICDVLPGKLPGVLSSVLDKTPKLASRKEKQEDNVELNLFYGEDNERTKEYLLLYNVAYCWRRWPMRYNFCQHRKVETWSLEHVFARNQQDLREDEFVDFDPKIKADQWEDYKNMCEDKRGDSWLAKELGKCYPSEEDHNIQNLALISKDANSSLSNKLFEGKRKKIIEWDSEKVYWVPPATQAVFFKAIKGANLRAPYWSNADKQSYVVEMGREVQDFINKVRGQES